MRIDRMSRYAASTLQAVADAREGGFRHQQHVDDEKRNMRRQAKARERERDWLAEEWERVFGHAS